MSVELTRGEKDQLTSIYANGPKWAGDLISKDATRTLCSMGLVSYNGAWAVVTEKGIKVVEDLLAEHYELRAIPGGFTLAFREQVRRMAKCILEERGWLRNARKEAEEMDDAGKKLERLVRFLRIDVRSVRDDRLVQDQLADLKRLILVRADQFDPVPRKTCPECEGLGKVPA